MKRGGIRRSLSDRRRPSSIVDTKTKGAQFIDSMALRNKGVRNDLRNIFDKETRNKLRPKEPPPPPPSRQGTPERPPRIQSAQYPENISFEKSFASRKIDNIYEDVLPGPLTKEKLSPPKEIFDELDEDILTSQLRLIHEKQHTNQTLSILSVDESKMQPFNVPPLVIQKQSPAVHRLKIKHDSFDNNYETLGHRKTSILITGDDCYSTVNVNDDSTPLYQSSVVVNDNSTSGISVIQTGSNTVTISVGSPTSIKTRTPEEDVIYTNNKKNTLLSINSGIPSVIVPIISNNDGGGNKTFINLTTTDIIPEVPSLKSNEKNDLDLIMKDPVEAVKRNLIPHICGKTDSNDNASLFIPTNTKINNSKKREESEYSLRSQKNGFISKLLEDPTLGHVAEGLDDDLVAKLIENSLIRLKENRNSLELSGTKDDVNVNKMIDVSLQKVQEERAKIETKINKNNLSSSSHPDADRISTRSSISSGNSYGSAAYEIMEFDNQDNLSDCYHSCSSEITTDDDGTTLSRSKFYQMLVDATLSEIEISNNVDDEHQYETIRMNGGDPIYEEISEVPPPLPLSSPPSSDDLDKKGGRSMFEGASKYDILSYLVDAKERGIVSEDSFTYNFDPTIAEEETESVSELHKRQSSDISSRISHISNVSDISEDNSVINNGVEKITAHRKTSAEIERNDSGVGSETSKSSRSRWQTPPGSILDKNSPIHLCEDCDGPVETQITDAGVMYAPLVCRKCGKKRAERKEIITEIVETEEKYGRDLQIILEEFYQPMLVAGLLTQEQLSAIFLNTEELLENNQSLAERMRDALDIANEQGDDDLLTVNLGKTFLEAAPMLHSFENYCVRQGAASLLLANLEKEKELLRIFLRVSQMENSVLRRMNLNSFLMVCIKIFILSPN